ncbi:MAG: serine--tRNA ligase [Candidatus Paceibacterota bacterium]
MLDIHFIRDNKDLVQEAAKKKRIEFDVAQLLEIDDRRKLLQQEVDGLRAQQNSASDVIAATTDPDEKQQKIAESKEVKEALQKKEEELKGVLEQWKALMIRVPNIPDMSVPDGDDEGDNQELKQVGEKPKSTFEPKDHIELMTNLGMVDFDRGTKIHGFRGYVLIGDGALLSTAVWNCARDFYLKKNFVYALPPAIAKKEYFYGTGHLPTEAEDLYVTQDDDYLSGTSEVPMMAYHADEVLTKDELPKRYLAFSPCYRREAGSHGKDTKGLLRVHEFYKLEQLVLCEADHQISVEYHEELNRNTEEFLELLGLPYRQVLISSGDLGSGKVKQYDTDLWIPSQQTYREISSASYYHDFQSRRFNIRYDDEGKKKYVHSLNATAIPTPRVLIALIENNQNEDGSVTIPPALRPYLDDRESFTPRA